MDFMQAYPQIKAQFGDGPTSGNNFGGYGSPDAALQAWLGGSYGKPAAPVAPPAQMAPQALPMAGSSNMLPQGAQAPMAGPMASLGVPPGNESPTAMARRYAQALLQGGAPPAGWQSAMDVQPAFKASGMQQPSQQANDDRLRMLLAQELAKQPAGNGFLPFRDNAV